MFDFQTPSEQSCNDGTLLIVNTFDLHCSNESTLALQSDEMSRSLVLLKLVIVSKPPSG